MMATDLPPTPDRTDRAALARAVASRDRVGHIDAENILLGWMDLDEAVARDLSFFVHTTDTILAVDFDRVDAATCAAQLFLSLRSRGLLPLLLDSGGLGRRHLFCRVSPEDRSHAEQEARAVGGDVRTAIRPPLSRHRLGGRSRLLLPTNTGEGVDRLHHGQGRRLAPGTTALIESTVTGYEDRSREILRVAVGVINQGWSFEEFELLLDTPGSSVHQMYTARADERGEETARAWLRAHIWPKAHGRVRSRPPRRQCDPRRLPALLNFATAMPWPGRDGPAARAVFLALVLAYRRCGVEPFNLSQREMAEMAGLGSRNTVSVALDRLVSQGLIRQHSGRAASRTTESGVADAWSFEEPARTTGATPGIHNPGVVLNHLGNDLFHQREFGKTRQLAYDTVLVQPDSTRRVAERSGISIKTTRRHLRTLSQPPLGLIIRGGDGLWRTTAVDLDQLAHDLSIKKRGERQRERHAMERKAYRREECA